MIKMARADRFLKEHDNDKWLKVVRIILNMIVGYFLFIIGFTIFSEVSFNHLKVSVEQSAMIFLLFISFEIIKLAWRFFQPNFDDDEFEWEVNRLIDKKLNG